MDYQAVYSTVKAHLLKQGKKAQWDEGGGVLVCVYRTESGLKCAIGALIPDEAYVPEMDSKFNSSIECNSLVQDAIGAASSADVSFLQALQRVHDLHDVADWPYKLADVALRFGLKDE